MSTCTCTAPEACALRAMAGYGGVTRWTALPFITPPEIGACGVGLAAGGGGSSLTSTFVGAEMMLPVVPGAIGATAFVLAVPTMVTTPLRTGGTSLALAETVLGTRSARLTSAINSLRTSTFFSMITTLGTPRDVTLQQLKIECFFPADAITEQTARRLASAAPQPIAV